VRGEVARAFAAHEKFLLLHHLCEVQMMQQQELKTRERHARARTGKRERRSTVGSIHISE